MVFKKIFTTFYKYICIYERCIYVLHCFSKMYVNKLFEEQLFIHLIQIVVHILLKK